MKTIKIKLFVEEMDSLKKGNGKEVGIYDDEEIKVIISYDKKKGGDTHGGRRDKSEDNAVDGK